MQFIFFKFVLYYIDNKNIIFYLDHDEIANCDEATLAGAIDRIPSVGMRRLYFEIQSER